MAITFRRPIHPTNKTELPRGGFLCGVAPAHSCKPKHFKFSFDIFHPSFDDKESIEATLAAMPQHIAVSLRLTVRSSKKFRRLRLRPEA
jgi:hypothetical protein